MLRSSGAIDVRSSHGNEEFDLAPDLDCLGHQRLFHRHLYWIKENLWAPMIAKMTITYYDIIFFIQFLLAYFHFEEFIPLMLLFMLILSCLYPPTGHH
jgi:hypothetical protein